jgi:hypothetical protein
MRITDIIAPPGGVMTEEVGVITGELTIKTEVEGSTATVRAQYKDADEWYTLATLDLTDPESAVQSLAVTLLHRPE